MTFTNLKNNEYTYMTKNNRLPNGNDSVNVLNGLVFLVFINATNEVLFYVVQGFLLSFQSKVICIRNKHG